MKSELRAGELSGTSFTKPPHFETEDKDIVNFAEQIAWSALEEMKYTLFRTPKANRTALVENWNEFSKQSVNMTLYFHNGQQNGWFKMRKTDYIDKGRSDPWEKATEYMIHNKNLFMDKLRESRAI